MPNWCSNSVTFWHDDEKELQRLVDAYNSGRTMGAIWPCPDELKIVAGCVGPPGSPEQVALEAKQAENLAQHGAKDWYDWCCDNWGTKWDFGRENDQDKTAVIETDAKGRKCVRLGFDTAWAPPLGFYAHLHNALGFTVKAYYFEQGMGFCGIYTDDNDRLFKIEEFTQDWIGDNIPSSLCEAFNLFEEAAQQEEWAAERNTQAIDDKSKNA